MLITPERALRIILSHVWPLKAHAAAMEEALGCFLAQDVRSDRDQPPADRSAMDGYAVIAADLRAAPARLRLIGEVAAGSGGSLGVRRGSCAAILTGGNVPPGADAVVPLEQTDRDGEEVVFHVSPAPGVHIRRRGEEALRGQVLLPRGARLGPAEIGVCAMVGKTRLKVHSRPKVAVLSTGGEVRDVGEPVAAHQLRDSNGPTLLAALAAEGLRDTARWIAPDDPKLIAARLKASLRTYRVAIVTGGVSVGRYDYVPEAVRRIGGRIRFHGVKMKPGRPQLYATLPGNRHVFALPGNPVSVLTGFHEMVLPALRRLCGAREDACRPTLKLALAAPIRSKGNRAYFALARIAPTEQGPLAMPVRSAGSADIVAACEADGVILVPEGIQELPAGSMIEFHPWTIALYGNPFPPARSRCGSR